MRVASNVQLLRLGNLEAILNQLAAAVTVPFVVPYAVVLGAGSWEAGLITALPLLAVNVAQVPAARWGARSAHPRRFLLLAGGLARIAWLAMAALMLLGLANLPALLIAAVAASASTGLLSPVWTSFLAEQVPAEERGRYFGTRNLLGGVAALGGASAAAYLVSLGGFTHGYGVALTLATVALCGALAAQILAVGTDPYPSTVATTREPTLEVWRLPAVRSYAAYGVLLILGAGIATPFYSVFFINQLHGSPEMATTMIAMSNGVAALAQGVWGRIIDRHGLRLVAGGSLAVIALQPLMWVAATDPIHGVPIWLINGLAWAACNLANFSLVLAISNPSNRPSVVAWISVFQAPADFAAPLIGGFLANQIDLPAIFVISSLIRLAALGLFLRGFTLEPDSIGESGIRVKWRPSLQSLGRKLRSYTGD